MEVVPVRSKLSKCINTWNSVQKVHAVELVLCVKEPC